MLAERKRIQLAKQTAAKKGAAPKKVKPKPEWNNYLTDDDRFKADQKSILLKKKLLVSQNNIFVSNGDVSLGIKPRHKPIVITSAPSVMPSPANKTMPSKEVNALDLIISAKDKEIGRKSNVPTNGRVGRSMSAHRITRDDGRMEKENLDLDNDRSDGNRIAIEWMGRNASDVNSAHSREIARERREFLLSNSPDDSPANQSSLSVGSMGGKTNKSIRNPSPMKRSSIITTANSLNSPAKATNSRMNTTVSSDGTAASPVKRVKNITEDKDYDLVYVADEIRSLFSELKYYEELSGRRSILDTREVWYKCSM